MKALIYNGIGKYKVVDKPDPKVQAGTDALVRMVRTTICGSDLHILKGDVPTVTDGRTLGHEGIGVIEEAGADVKNFKKGDRVVIRCITCCATCSHSHELTLTSMADACRNDGGWILGHTSDGTQAERVLIKHADASLFMVPPGADERTLLVFSDILPTGLEVGVLRGKVTPGSSVAIVGAGPVGLAAGITAQLYSPRELVFFDLDDHRLSVAKKIGATHVYNTTDCKDIRALAKDHIGEADGFDVVIEAVGIPATFNFCEDLVGVGGNIANVGVHAKPVKLNIDKLWPRSISQYPHRRHRMSHDGPPTSPWLWCQLVLFLDSLTSMAAGKLDASDMVSHDFKFSQIEEAYDFFGRAAETKSLKVNIEYE
ncbi:alcohol dehydrogenase like protein [Zymoseptoria brevis]|uniref:Alcohol dehydrogenase like protein n=1 Tax=Zymoseptoria brevis TaxID=1047168 RepID=A0A0F4GYG3_9PEZI|nr:alcohol dehydrogenase like protein [Zymoseptoria brevis]